MTGMAGMGGAGGGPVCGNGVIEPPEECDEQTPIAYNFCTDCQMECNGDDMAEDPDTHHCYVRVAGQRTWDAQHSHCFAIYDADLAVVRSDAERARVGALAGAADVWIGGRGSGDTWTWITGEAFDYDNWANGQPATGDYMVTAAGGLFFSATCTLSFPAICEISPPGQSR